jgi:hypothetical protein
MEFDTEKTQAQPSNPFDEGFLRRAKDAENRRLADCRTTAPQRAMTSEEIVAEFFKYHAPNDFTIPKYAAINQAAKNFAEVVLANCPRGADLAAAIRLIRDARMTANAAIALNGLSLY